MKTSLKYTLLVGLSAGLTLTGCDRVDPLGDPTPIPAQRGFVDIIASDRNFSRLAQAVVKANIGSTVLSGQNLTLFAPNNAAFAAAGIDSAAIARMDVATITAVLRSHVLSTAVRSSDIPEGINRETATLGGPVYVSKFNFGTPAVAVNGVRVTTPDITATNGVMHIIDNVIIPPAGNIVSIVQGNPNFTFLLAAVQRAGLAADLSAPGPITVFAPTDEAFRTTTPFRTLADINAAPPATLAAILRYHVTPGRVYTTNFVPEAFPVAGGIPVSSSAARPGRITTLAGSTINVSGDLRLTGLGNGTDAARITRANVSATNGVVHVIDRVLLPQ